MEDIGFALFKLTASGYCCAQVMMKTVLDAEGITNDDLLRAVNGFCLGAGSYQKTCGILTGGTAILGLYAGKGNAQEYPHPNFSKMVDDYTEWFLAEYGSTECKDIIGTCTITDFQSNQSYQLKCGDILINSIHAILSILQKYEFEFGNRHTSCF